MLLFRLFHAVTCKCNFTELTTESACVPLIVSSVNTYMYVQVPEFYMLVSYVQEAFSDIFVRAGSSSPRQFSSHPFPPAFYCFNVGDSSLGCIVKLNTGQKPNCTCNITNRNNLHVIHTFL